MKHPDYFSKMGLSHFNLKNFDDSKSLDDSDINTNNFLVNDEINRNEKNNDSQKNSERGSKKKRAVENEKHKTFDNVKEEDKKTTILSPNHVFFFNVKH